MRSGRCLLSHGAVLSLPRLASGGGRGWHAARGALAMPRTPIPPRQPVDLERVDRFTLPVRDLNKPELSDTHVLGGEVVQRDAVEMGQHDHPATRVHMCDGVDLVLVQQWYG